MRNVTAKKRKIDNREIEIITLVIEFQVQFSLNVKFEL